MPAAAAQFHLDSANPVRAPRVRSAPPVHSGQIRTTRRDGGIAVRVQAYMFYGCAIFFLAADIVYWFWSDSDGAPDWTGATALALSVGLAGLIGFYIHFTIRRLEGSNQGPLPEDHSEAEIADGAGDLGF